MTTIIIIEKSGAIKERVVKSISEDTLYKSAGFKTDTDFKCCTIWELNVSGVSYSIELYGKKTGRAGQENKYELPPPLDTTLFFGSCVIVHRCKTTGNFLNITETEWNTIYSTLYGGFEDIEESEDDEDEYDSDDGLPKTKNGYSKDGFVVDDDEDEDDGEDDDEDDDTEDDTADESEEEFMKKSMKNVTVRSGRSKPKSKKSAAAATSAENNTVGQTAESIYLDCTTELAMEEYDDEN